MNKKNGGDCYWISMYRTTYVLHLSYLFIPPPLSFPLNIACTSFSLLTDERKRTIKQYKHERIISVYSSTLLSLNLPSLETLSTNRN